MKQVERPQHRRIGLEEFPGEALHAVPADEEIEALSQKQRCVRGDAGEKDAEESEHREALVELHRMAPDAVAEIDAPGQRRRDAESVIRQSSKEAAPTPDADAQRQRRDQTKSGRAADAGGKLE